MKTLLVTGAAGFIGSNLVRAALAREYHVVGLDSLTYAGNKKNLENLPSDKFRFLEQDIRSPAIHSVLQEVRPDAVLNLAAESHVDRSIEAPLLFVETNILGTANLLQASLAYWEMSGRQPGFRFLQVSTDEVYGSLGDEGKFSEGTPLQPRSPYSASKAGADLLVEAWHHTYSFPTILTRCSNNYGAFQFPEKLIPLVINRALAGMPLPVYGEGKNIRDWIHVSDHCEGLLLALEKGTPGGTYCFGGGSEKRNIDLVKMICAELDQIKPRADGASYKNQISFVKDRPGHDYRYAIDDTLARNQLGFRPRTTLEEGLQETVAWYLANGEWTKSAEARARGAKR
jgi:dTDP-glucose 4,6-dehydratase